jgi:GT2 family glycosyltransferase
MSDKKLSIIVLCFNKWNFTKACLNDLSRLPNDHEIIVVDNGSTDETQSNLHKSSEIKYLRQDENQGFAKGNNWGFCFTKAPNIMFLNNDIRVRADHSTWTQKIIDKCENAIVGPTMGQLDDQLNFIQEANKILPGKSYMSGWCLASSREIWNKLDMPRPQSKFIVTDCHVPQIFSEEFGLAYFEDTDLSFRAKKIGIKFEVVDIPVVHFGKQTSSQLNTYQLYKKAKEIFVKKWTK